MNDPSKDDRPEADSSDEQRSAASPPVQSEPDRTPTTNGSPIVAKLVEPPTISDSVVFNADGIRVGSPFREDSLETTAALPATPEASYADFGPYVYTAMGSAIAALVVVGFAVAGSVWFPAGGTVVSLFGALLSMLGLFATGRYRWLAIGSLLVHGGLFSLSYARWLS
ncbi:MAG: hypothetical protein AAGJ83_00220 [Planctomycetota bacterium]